MELHLTMSVLASEMQISVDCLIRNFLAVGIVKTKFDLVTKIEKNILLRYMNDSTLMEVNKLSLQRKTKSTLSVSSISGKNKKVQIEVRKKCVYTVPRSIRDQSFYEESVEKVPGNINSKICDHNGFKNKITQDQSKVLKSCENSDQSIALSSSDNIEQIDGLIFSNSNIKHTLISDNTNDKRYDKLLPYINKDKQSNNKDMVNSCVEVESLHFFNKKIDNDKLYVPSDVSELKVKSDIDGQKLNRDRKQNSRVRFRHRTIGKIVKQKRNNSINLYENIEEKLDDVENFYIPNRLNKIKRKESVLIQSFNKPSCVRSRDIEIGESISVSELSNKMSVKSSYMIKVMMNLGVEATANQILDQDTAQLIIEEMGHNAVIHHDNKLERLIMDDYRNINNIREEDRSDYKNRAPIVTIMGHVDHGKTSLLDYIRSAKVVDSELGGITQKIGAYHVSTSEGMITFLDTPGHEAFISMRTRGILLTDIVVLVVAADDGVMPQTIEAIQQVKSTDIPVIVAVNKIDKSRINIDQIKQELSRYGLVPEDWGGETQFINISAISGIGINNLLAAIMLQSEILELKVFHTGIAKAAVIESILDRKRGLMVTVLVREGTLKCGDIVLCGTEYGRIKAMYDEYNHVVVDAGPSVPVKLLGLSGVPDSGDMVVVVRNEKKAREVAEYRKLKRREFNLTHNREKLSVENIFDNVKNLSKVCELNFIIKADTQGSVEVISESLIKLSTDRVVIKILSSAIGVITETDFVLASASKAAILCFNVKIDSSRYIVGLNNLDIRYYSVIYDLLDDVKKMVRQILDPNELRYHSVIGVAEVRDVFQSVKSSNIAGCIVVQGVIRSDSMVKIKRNNIVIYEGKLESLRRFKDDVNEVKIGSECGLIIKGYNDIQSKDVIEALDVRESSIVHT